MSHKIYYSRWVAQCLICVSYAVYPQLAIAEEATTAQAPGSLTPDRFFVEEVWVKAGERTCLKCHKENGDASESSFLLRGTRHDKANRRAAIQHNFRAFQRIALTSNNAGQSRLLLKVSGKLDHGGGEVLKENSTAYQILKRFVRRSHGLPSVAAPVASNHVSPFFAGVEMISPRRLLRRVTLSLAGRLPTADEVALIQKEGLTAMDSVLDSVMKEEAFYERLREAFNDILLTNGFDGAAEGVFSYRHFHKSRNWYQKRDPNKGRMAGERLSYSTPEMKTYYKLVKQYRQAIRREPLELISHIVRNERPFTEVVTADYIMVSPYTARGYGIFDKLKDQFKNTDDPFEFIATRLPALTDDSSGKVVQRSKTGFYPHAGIASTFQYLKRYPTTETNRNRLRVRMYFEHFLGVDILELAPRTGDAAAITAKYEIPTMQAAGCVVCHKTLDPVAGLFQDYYALDGKGIYQPRKDGWYKDMFGPGVAGEDLPAPQKWRSLQWLGKRTAEDPRFAAAMVGHVWYILTGREPLLPPEDIDAPTFSAQRRAYRAQRDEMERIAEVFTAADFNLKVVFKQLVKSPFYRADGLATATIAPQRHAELADIGVSRLLTPEQLERKIYAIFGVRWGKLTDQESKLGILYGGIDSKEITQRNTVPSGAMGAIQRLMANDLSCQHVATDFSLTSSQRRLFPGIEPDVTPGDNAQADAKIRQAIVHLHALLLGRHDEPASPEVNRTYDLFAGIVSDAKTMKGLEPRESYSCQSGREVTPRDADPHYTIRAWRAVVTYLLRQHEFLYE